MSDLDAVLDVSFDEAIERTRESLAKQGFGVLVDLDIARTLKEKIDVDFRRYRILGACNPKLAHRALSADLGVGLALPCNVVVYEDDAGRSVVRAFDPRTFAGADAPAPLREVAEDVRALLVRAIADVTRPGA